MRIIRRIPEQLKRTALFWLNPDLNVNKSFRQSSKETSDFIHVPSNKNGHQLFKDDINYFYSKEKSVTNGKVRKNIKFLNPQVLSL